MASSNAACKVGLDSQKLDVSVRDSKGNTPLHQLSAIANTCKTHEETQKLEEKDIKNLKLMLKFNPNVNIKNTEGYTCVHLAIKNKRPDALVKVLLDQGAECDYSFKDQDGCNVLHHAVLPVTYNLDSYSSEYSSLNFTFRDVSIIKHLIEKGARIDTVAKNGYSPLLIAVVMRKTEYVKVMLQKKSNLSQGGLEKTINTHCCSGDNNNNDYNYNHYSNNFSYPPRGYYHMTPLQIAVHDDNKAMAQLLIKAGANVNAVNGNTSNDWYVKYNTQFDKMTPLMISAYKCNLKIARILVSAGANVNAVAAKGANALHIIIKSNIIDEKRNVIEEQTEIAKLLIGSGIGLNAKDESGEVALQLALRHSNKDIVTHILEKGLAAL